MKKKNRDKSNAFDEVADLIDRYEKGTANPTEREALEEWSPVAERATLLAEDERKSSLCEKKVWEHLSMKFHLAEGGNNSGKRWRTLRPAIYRYTAIAAMLLLVIGIAWLLADKDEMLLPEPRMAAIYSAPVSGMTSQKLSDGSRVELNRESTLTVGEAFGRRRREVKMQGQVFFDVAKNPEKPFVVEAAGIEVTVRGTSFEVIAYDELPERAVTVCTGRVEVRSPRSGELLATLSPGEQLIFNPATGKGEIKKVDAEAVTAWREGRLVLHDASLAELRLRVRQYFGKRLEIENNALPADVRISSSFNYDELTVPNVMTRLCTLFSLRSRTEGDRIILSPENR